MDPQLIAVALIVTVATLYVVRRTVRAWAGGKKGSCGGGCGCAKAVERSISERGVVQLEVRTQ
jgi:hypothetical protein